MANPDGMLDELLNDASDTMTAWEAEFIDSLDKQRGRNPDWEPSGKQLFVLEKVWGKVFVTEKPSELDQIRERQEPGDGEG